MPGTASLSPTLPALHCTASQPGTRPIRTNRKPATRHHTYPKIFPAHLSMPQKYFCLISHRTKYFSGSTQYEPEKYLGHPPGNDRSCLNGSCLTCAGRAKNKFASPQIGPKRNLAQLSTSQKYFWLVPDWAGKIFAPTQYKPKKVSGSDRLMPENCFRIRSPIFLVMVFKT